MADEATPTLSKTPPAAKVATAQGVAVSGVVAQLTELAVGLGAVWLRSIDQLSEQNLLYVLFAVVVGPGIAKIRGTTPTASIALLAAALPWIVKKSVL